VSRRDPRRDRALLAAWLAASFALSAVSDALALAAAWAVALALLARGAGAHLRRVVRLVLPLSLGASAAAVAFAWLAGAAPPAWPSLLALNLRASLLAFLAFALLARVDVLAAVEPWPWAMRLLALVLAQVHALRLVATESRLGLASRLARRPRAREVVRGAGAVTASLLALAGRNARDAADALRARGF
jgi:cobalt/nickel transport system permease protein